MRPAEAKSREAFHDGVPYALTGYPHIETVVYGLNPSTGVIVFGPLVIQAPANDDADGFTVLPNGSFLINEGDMSPEYVELDRSSGAPKVAGLAIDLQTFAGLNLSRGTGVATSADGLSVHFIVNITKPRILAQTDLNGTLIGSKQISSIAIEDIDVFVP